MQNMFWKHVFLFLLIYIIHFFVAEHSLFLFNFVCHVCMYHDLVGKLVKQDQMQTSTMRARN